MTIDLYTWSTPNGRKVSIMLEACGLPYAVHSVNIGMDEQFAPDFLKISPNNKIPAIVDPDGPDGAPIAMFETGAILYYLAEKTGKFQPTDAAGRMETMVWLMWQMGGFGPMLGQAHHFLKFAKEDVPYAKARYYNETKRLYGVLDRRLEGREWMAADQLTIADFATYPWVMRFDYHQIDLADYPNVLRWKEALDARPDVARGMAVPSA